MHETIDWYKHLKILWTFPQRHVIDNEMLHKNVKLILSNRICISDSVTSYTFFNDIIVLLWCIFTDSEPENVHIHMQYKQNSEKNRITTHAGFRGLVERKWKTKTFSDIIAFCCVKCCYDDQIIKCTYGISAWFMKNKV